jgi:hypothetical protein
MGSSFLGGALLWTSSSGVPPANCPGCATAPVPGMVIVPSARAAASTGMGRPSQNCRWAATPREDLGLNVGPLLFSDFLFLKSISDLKFPGNPFKIPKLIINCRKFRKIQIKFP